jgi:hypothetical protein
MEGECGAHTTLLMTRSDNTNLPNLAESPNRCPQTGSIDTIIVSEKYLQEISVSPLMRPLKSSRSNIIAETTIPQ